MNHLFTPCPLCLHQLDKRRCCPNCHSIFQATDTEMLADAIDTRLRMQAADRMAATMDLQLYRGQLDPRDALSSARLDYGDPFSLEEIESLFHNVACTETVAAATVECELQVLQADDAAGQVLFYKTADSALGTHGLPLLDCLPQSMAAICRDGTRFNVTIRVLAPTKAKAKAKAKTKTKTKTKTKDQIKNKNGPKK